MYKWLWFNGASKFNIIQLGICIDLKIRKERDTERLNQPKRTRWKKKKHWRRKQFTCKSKFINSIFVQAVFLMHLHSHARRHSCKQESLYAHLGRLNKTEGVWGEGLGQRQAERDERLYPPVSSMRQLYVTEHEMKADCRATSPRPLQPNGPCHRSAPHLQSDLKN